MKTNKLDSIVPTCDVNLSKIDMLIQLIDLF